MKRETKFLIGLALQLLRRISLAVKDNMSSCWKDVVCVAQVLSFTMYPWCASVNEYSSFTNNQFTSWIYHRRGRGIEVGATVKQF